MLAGLTGILLAAKPGDYAKAPAELITQAGWLSLLIVVLVFLWVWTRTQSVRRSLLALEDPRMFALMRIGFGLMTIQVFWNLHPYWRMLWSDEGLFTLAETRQRYGRTALSGWSPTTGFFDSWAILRFFTSKYSAFYFWASPEFIAGYLYATFAVLLLFAAGVWSRFTGILGYLMMSSIYNHNALYLEGTDTVYRVFWFLLLFCKTGHAWSFDNWWRCRRLRKKGLLDDGSPTPENLPKGKTRQPIYRLIPAWPRYLMMFQLVGIYSTTGMVKTGSVWARGDALYYALNMDHFYRFLGFTQWVSSVLATTGFRVMTWVTHWWEMSFSLVGLGMLLKFGLDHKDQAWYRAQQAGKVRLWLGRASLLGVLATVYYLNTTLFPYCINVKKATDPEVALRVANGLAHIHIGYIALTILIAIWWIVGSFPMQLIKPGKRLFGRIPVPSWTLSQDWMRKWLLGRRVWLTLGLMFHGFLFLFMNIGMFPLIMVMTYAAWFRGDEVSRACQWLVQKARAIPRLGKRIPATVDRLFVPAQAPESVAIRGRLMPTWLILLLGLGAFGLLYLRIEKTPDLGDYVYLWFGACLVSGLVFRLWWLRARKPTSEQLGGGPALAYGTLGRTIALLLALWHGVAIVSVLFPGYPVFNTYRGKMRTFFSWWVRSTATTQSWRMFAPNPPRANSFMKSVVIDQEGTRWDLQNNSIKNRPNPWIWNDRMRKMQRRMVGKGKWYLKHWAAFHCREWMLRTGEMPVRVEVEKLWYRMPKPEQVTTQGYYNPYTRPLRNKHVQNNRCKESDLPLRIKQRRGLEITQENLDAAAKREEAEARKFKARRRTWEQRRNFFGSYKRKNAARTKGTRPPREVPQAPGPLAPSTRSRPDQGDGEK